MSGLARRIFVACVAGALLLWATGAPSLAQGYGEQAPLQFQFQGQSDQVRLQIEATRQSLSSARAASGSAGSGLSGTAGALTNKSQTGSDLNNVIQYYNNSSTSINISGNNNTASAGGVLNVGQNSTGTSQVLNNQSDSSSGNTSGILKK